ncbi:lipopolysaccharide biosynthesis protein [Synechococcus sp. N5]|uniref:lipopolysaccharide biosynthesis protein n=1 Tax=Synechococcus sp. N5 TaxID=2575515 RepID=UPI000E0F2B11|nr:oligosaccharide flippase family protein [Synechococcus sp. N5]
MISISRRTIKSIKLSLKPLSASSRNVLKLVKGSAGSQIFSVAAIPLLTRLYSPENFGIVAVLSSILSVLNVVSSLRYELAISVPEDEDDAIALVWLCFVLVLISTLLTALLVLLLGDYLVSWLNEPEIKSLLWLLPLGVLLTGIYSPLSYWAIRCKQFDLLARTKFRQGIFGVATNLAAFPMGVIGLLFGQIVSQSAGSLSILRNSEDLWKWSNISPSLLFQTLKKYSHFGIYSSPAGLINTFGNKLPILIIASTFQSSQVGLLALSQRLLLLPAGLIGNAVGKVFLSEATQHNHSNTLYPLIIKVSRKLLSLGIALSIIYCLVLVPLIPIIFGQKWSSASALIPLLIPLFLGTIVVKPLSMGFIASGNVKTHLLAQIIIVTLKVLPVYFLAHSIGFDGSIALFSFCSMVGYLVVYVFLLKSTAMIQLED